MLPRIRRAARTVFQRASGFRLLRLGRVAFNFQREVGDVLENSAVAATVQWIARTFPEAPPTIWPVVDDDSTQRKALRRHPMIRLLERPNRYYTGPLLWMATLVDWIVNGETYWLVERNRGGAPANLYWVPSWTMRPEGDERTFISHYIYTVNGEEIRYEIRDVIHLRYGLDPEDPRHGTSPLKSALAEVFTDNEAAVFTASILRNMGVPGLLVSPDTDAPIDEKDAEAAKAYLDATLGGSERGRALVMKGRTKVEQFGFSPEQLVLRDIRRIPEERVTALTGIPAMVVGLGAGLDRSTFTNMGEAREAAYEAGLIPIMRILAEDVRFQLLANYERDPHAFVFGFDLSQVRVLQEDAYRMAQRMDVGIRGGWVQVAEGRIAVGLIATEADRIYLRQSQLVQVPAGGGDPVPLAPSSGNGNGAGNAHANAEVVADAVERRLDRRELTAPVGDRGRD